MKFNFTSSKQRWYLIAFLIFTFGIYGGGTAFAQTAVVNGVVKDAAGNPIIGASVIEKGTTNGMSTDQNGAYAIQLRSKNPVLEF